MPLSVLPAVVRAWDPGRALQIAGGAILKWNRRNIFYESGFLAQEAVRARGPFAHRGARCHPLGDILDGVGHFVPVADAGKRRQCALASRRGHGIVLAGTRSFESAVTRIPFWKESLMLKVICSLLAITLVSLSLVGCRASGSVDTTESAAILPGR
jgi:hypothetical protein